MTRKQTKNAWPSHHSGRDLRKSLQSTRRTLFWRDKSRISSCAITIVSVTPCNCNELIFLLLSMMAIKFKIGFCPQVLFLSLVLQHMACVMALNYRLISEHAHLALPSFSFFCHQYGLYLCCPPTHVDVPVQRRAYLAAASRTGDKGRQAGKDSRSCHSLAQQKRRPKKSVSLALPRGSISVSACFVLSPLRTRLSGRLLRHQKSKSSIAADAASPSHFSPAPCSADLARTIINFHEGVFLFFVYFFFY